jgi:protein-S-isoprenylcysteine O-methyltransferase Ste14
VLHFVLESASLSKLSLALYNKHGTTIAITFLLAGTSIALAGVSAFRTHSTTVNPTTPHMSSTVVKTGIYRFTRNPMYLGFSLILIGWAIYLSNAASVLGLPIFITYINIFQIKPEERFLTDKFGEIFSEYMLSVPRWI